MSAIVGMLRHRVTLEEPVRVADEIGGAAILWTARGDVWAQIRPRRADEYAQYDASFSRGDHVVFLRRRDDVRHPWRIVWGARQFRVVGRVDVGDEAALIALFCEEETL